MAASLAPRKLLLKRIRGLGYEQRSDYSQPDLWHEEVVELSSPFAPLVHTGTKVFTFLILGDQNAGKSTFLHSFTFDDDPNFLALSSSLPILTSSFLNSRFVLIPGDDQVDSNEIINQRYVLSSDQTRLIMDEPPFIDTDLARGTFLLTAEDFRFFIDENNVPNFDCSTAFDFDTRFVVVQLIEVGGDHLDSLMELHESRKNNQKPIVSPWVEGILDQTQQLLKDAKRTIYFINATTLLSANEQGYQFIEQAAKKLLSRIQYLNDTLAQEDEHQILFYITRFTKDAPVVYHGAALPVEEAVGHLIESEKQKCNWKIGIIGIYQANYLIRDSSGELKIDVATIEQTLCKLFANQMTHRNPLSFEHVVTKHIFDSFRQSTEHLRKLVTFGNTDALPQPLALWLDSSTFWDHLEHGEFFEIPETTILQNFPLVALALSRAGISLLQQSTFFSKLRIVFRNKNSEEFSFESKLTMSQDRIAIRLPLFEPFFEFLAMVFGPNASIPPEFWDLDSQRIPISACIPEQHAVQLDGILSALVERICMVWEQVAANCTVSSLVVFFWLIEEWQQVSILQQILRNNQTSLVFPDVLQCNSDIWARIQTQLNHLHSENEKVVEEKSDETQAIIIVQRHAGSASKGSKVRFPEVYNTTSPIYINLALM